MPDISLVIVNYNVKHFIDQCIRSVLDATNALELEIIVVDNDSIDGSVDHIATHFPMVKLIANSRNVGFARANNQAIKIATAPYILLLNPDTLIEKDTLTSCFQFMKEHLDCGAMGVRMIDGEGKFLPESKRGFPSPFTSLMRLSGLSRLFPKSRFFNSYNLGYLPENETHQVDVLCGAFMFIRKAALDRVGLLDEDFFMYGEDIDLSYRIQQAGYSIYYYPITTIVHFKGESTKKSSLRYFTTFYRAMAIFARKHYGGKSFNPFLWLVNTAIFIMAIFDYGWKKLSGLLLPFLETGIFFGGLQFVESFWARTYYGDSHYYDNFHSLPIYLMYSLIWTLSLWMSGAYRRLADNRRVIFGIGGGSLIILLLYALMDNSLRHSRAVILLSGLGLLLFIPAFRFILRLVLFKRFPKWTHKESNVVVVGDPSDLKRAEEILAAGRERKKLIGLLSAEELQEKDPVYLQSLSRIEQVIDVFKVDEILFSADKVDRKEIMQWMTRLGSGVKIKILSREVQSIIGSHDRNTRGDLYTVEMQYRINLPYNRFLKWVLDFLLGLFLLPLTPLIGLLHMDFSLIRFIFRVWTRKATWVSYHGADQALAALPPLPPGRLAPGSQLSKEALTQDEMHLINFYYARDYSLLKDLEILLLNFWQIFQSRGSHKV